MNKPDSTLRYMTDSQNALTFGWHFFNNFTKEEFPEGVLHYLMYDVVYYLQELRTYIDAPILINPLVSAWIRPEQQDTAHSTNSGKELSTAGDVFVHKEDWFKIMTYAPKFFRGVGLYLDKTLNGENLPMFHLDIYHGQINRPRPLFWTHTNDGGYRYDNAGIVENIVKAQTKWGK